MLESNIYNLEKIKDITSPIEELQGKISTLESIYEIYNKNYDSFVKEYGDDPLVTQLNDITQILRDINMSLLKYSTGNLNEFLFFQEILIKKYKDSFKDTLKNLNLNQDFTKKIGLLLIEQKKISKIIDNSSFIPSLSLIQWLDLLNSLKNNSLFLTIINKMDKSYSQILMNRFEAALEEIPENTDEILIEKFKKSYLKNPISFEQFLIDIENQLSKEELKKKRKIVEKIKKKEEFDELKKRQEEEFHKSTYQDYIHLSSAEFNRKRRKKKREKLSEIAEKPIKEVEISQDVVEKIEKFKSQLHKSFQEEFLIQKDDQTDPLKVIRERKKLKDEEYQEFIKRFDEDKNEM